MANICHVCGDALLTRSLSSPSFPPANLPPLSFDSMPSFSSVSTSTSPLLDTFAIFSLSFGLHSLSASSPSLLLSLVLLSLLLLRVPHDLSTRDFSAPFPLAGGILLSYLVSVSVSDAGLLESVSVLGPAAMLVAALPVYGVLLLSHAMSGAASKRTRAGYTAQLLVLPLLWASGWSVYCSLHPLGRLLAWTPVRSMQGFAAVLPLLGLPGYDFLVGCMVTAVVTFIRLAWPSGTTTSGNAGEGDLLSIEEDQHCPEQPDERSPLLSPRFRPSPSSSGGTRRPSSIPLILLVSFLFALWVASAAVYNAAAPPHAGLGAGGANRIIKIGCVLPRVSDGEGQATLPQYMYESEVLSGRGAKVLLWPEGAAHFSSRAEYARFDEQVRSLAQRRRAYIAPSFTAQAHFIHNSLPAHYPSREVIASTLISPAGELVYSYAKQALVPIAETYSYERGSSPLPREHIFVPRAAARSSAAGTNVSISTAICHDTSYPAIMRQAYPSSLVLIPSSVFSEGLARNRISQLQASAQSLRTSYLVCDASPSGLSTFIDQRGDIRYFQAGSGSFDVSVSVDQGKRTPYGRYGEAGALGILMVVTLVCMALEAALRSGRAAVARAGNEAWEALKARMYHWTGWIFFRQPDQSLS